MGIRISKAKLLEKARTVEEVPVGEISGGEALKELFGEDAVVPLRRLTHAEWAKIEGFQSEGMKISGEPDFDEAGNPIPGSGMGMEIDVSKAQRAEARMREYAVAYCFNPEGEKEERITPDEAGALGSDVVVALSRKIFELSGVAADAEQLKSVRQNAGGAERGDDEPAGLPAGEQPAGPHALAG